MTISPSSQGSNHPRPAGWQQALRRWQSGPWVSWALLLITVVVYGLQLLSEVWLGYDFPAVWGAKWGPGIVHGQWWRLVAPLFLHGGLLHLGFNMYALYVLGPGLERLMGRWAFALLYFVSGYTGVVVSFALDTSPSLGASTAIFGLIGAYIVIYYQNRDVFGPAANAVLRNAILLALVNLAFGASVPQVDNWGHVGGLLGGMVFTALGGPRYQVDFSWFAGRSVMRNIQSQGRTLLAAVVVVLLFSLFLLVGWSKYI